jgi:ribosomal protein S18 acetylase RimI-like enzyme
VIVYEATLEGIRERDLVGFFDRWPTPPSPAKHLRLLHGSDFVVLAREAESGRVVGFATAIGDGVLSAFIPLLEVLPEYQRLGIGSELVRRMLDLLADTYMVDLCCDDDLVEFYERFEMSRWVGMGIWNRDALVE